MLFRSRTSGGNLGRIYHDHHQCKHQEYFHDYSLITAEPVVIEDINAIVVELVGEEGVRDKELANREGHNDGLDDHNDDHDTDRDGDHDGDHEFIHDGANREGHNEDLDDQNDDVDGDHEVLDDGVITGIVMMMTLMFRKPTI